MIRILNAEPADYSSEAQQVLLSIGQVDAQTLTREQLLASIAEYDVLIVRLGFKVDREVIDAGRQLRAIVTATTGLDHIDVDYAESRGIRVLSLRGQRDFLRTIPATVEHTWALLLALRRRVPWAFQSVLGGYWERDRFKGHDLAGQRLGVVGLGRIGERVAQLGLAFGMDVAAFDPYRHDWVSEVKRCETLPDLLRRSDVLSIHVPLNEETRNMIGQEELDLLPIRAVVVNTARGGIIDEIALVEALQSGRVSGAALDVVNHERNPAAWRESPLWDYARHHDNLLITPHIGGATFESMASTEIFMAKQLQQFLQANLA